MPAIARSEPFREQACPLAVCDGSGWILGPEDVARPCECREARLKRGRSKGVASAIPARFRGVSFDRPPVSDMARDMTTRHVVQATKDYIEGLDENIEAGRGLWMMGNTGTGKTTLGMLVAKEALAAGKTVGVYFTPKLLTRIRKTYQEAESGNAYDDFFRRVTSVDLLYIDDLGSERHTDWVVEQLYALVNERYENQRPMLVTSNADSDVDQDADHGLQQLKEQIGSRTVSRLVEICGDPLPLFGPDRRVQARSPN
ncbi:MAG TPA: ATP-binding protein [Solirubrobacterales bacterium]|nr:ATP-binding protein [Solirubrobacterales bacterium]